MEEVSKLHLYSMGVVAANKTPGSDIIEVTPTEKAIAMDGEITDAAFTYGAKATASDGQAYESETVASGSISAKWIPLGTSNRMTSPDVRRGEPVVLYRFANTDQIYWNTVWNDMRYRKLESVVFGISATQDENATPGADNMYFVEFNSRDGYIHLATSKANGEPFAYDLQLNTKEGFLKFQDDIGNYISLDSQERQIRLQVADGSFMELLQKVLNLHGVDTINMLAGKDINMTAGQSITEETLVKTTDAPATVIKGNLSTEAGRGGSTGSGTLRGDFELEGSMHAQKDLTADGKVKANELEWVAGITPPYP